MGPHILKAYFLVDPEYNYDRELVGERGSVITNRKIVSIPRDQLPVRIVKQELGKPTEGMWSKHVYTPTLMQRYAIDRLFRLYRIYDVTTWKINVTRGYYGDEIDGMECDKTYPFMDDVNHMLCLLDDLAIVKFLLQREYKYLLDTVRDATVCELVKIPVSELKHNTDYMNRVKQFEISDYLITDKELPIGVTYKGKFLIDGYHRVALDNTTEPQLFINIT